MDNRNLVIRQLQKILRNPAVFDFIQNLLRGDQVRQYFVDHYAKPVPGARVLDIGCGTGELRPFLKDCEYFGFDVDGRALERARGRFPDKTKFVLSDVSDIELPGGFFSIAIAAGVIHHLNDEQAGAMFRLAMHALQPGGRLCSFDMCDRGRGIFPTLMNKIDRGNFIRKESDYVRLARETFSDVQVFDYCGDLIIPVSHCVMVCTKPLSGSGQSRDSLSGT